MNKKIILLAIQAILLIMVPAFSFAQFDVGKTTKPPQDFTISVESTLNNIINVVLWPVMVTAIIVLFAMAGFEFLTSKGEPGKLETARKFLIWAIIGVIVFLVAFSIIATVMPLVFT